MAFIYAMISPVYYICKNMIYYISIYYIYKWNIQVTGSFIADRHTFTASPSIVLTSSYIGNITVSLQNSNQVVLTWLTIFLMFTFCNYNISYCLKHYILYYKTGYRITKSDY